MAEAGLVSRYAMEGRGPRGFGWEYPPGASGSASPVRARCEKCGEEAEVVVVRELGSTYTEPEGCAGCGGAFDLDNAEDAEPPEPDDAPDLEPPDDYEEEYE
jgi:hypothetical protein